MNVKQILFGILLLVGAAFALTVTSAEPVQTVTSGQAAAFEIVFAGNRETVELTADSELPISISQSSFEVTGVQTVDIIAYTQNFGTGAYGIELVAESEGKTYTYQLSVVIKEQEPSLKLDLVYDSMKVVPGEDEEIKFTLTNTGTQTLKNIIIKSDIIKSFDPEYPTTLILTPGEEDELSIAITVPKESADEEYVFTITAASGDIEVSKEFELEVTEEKDVTDAVSLDVNDEWKAIKDVDGNTVGYEITFKVENSDPINLKNVKVEFTGMPTDWAIKGDTEFDLDAYAEDEYTVKVYPKSFDEISAKMKLVYDNEAIASETISFAGYKVGAPTGMFFTGGSLTIGILLVVVIALVVLYIRQKNIHSEQVEDIKTKAYLEELVKKAQAERETKKGKK